MAARSRDWCASGRIGDLRVISGVVQLLQSRPAGHAQHSVEYGGGALLDIGCYPVTLSRFLFGEEPVRVVGSIERDPEERTDRLTSAILKFPSGRCAFTCSTQLAYNQRMQIARHDGAHRDRQTVQSTDR